jgi:hypothetical protein
MALSAKERAEYLDTLRTHGGEKALHAGLDLLKAVDSGKPIPKAKVAKGAKAHPAVAEAEALTAKINLGGIGKKAICSFKCALTNNPKKDPVGFALCVFQCITS